MQKFILTVLVALLCLSSFSQDMTTYQFAEKDGQALFLDLYTPDNVTDSTICVVYVFGGGFKEGERNNEFGINYCRHLAQEGFMAAAIDYRLGMKEAKNVGILNYEPVETAIHMATEDVISALAYLVGNADVLKVNPEWIVLVGSSAGAISVLQTDYVLCNGFLNSDLLPSDFRLAGVASYSGAIFSHEGLLKYRNHAPAPTMFFHGTADKLVNYGQMRFFSLGFFGSSKIVPRFEKFGYPFYFRRYSEYGHSVAMMLDSTIDDFKWFVHHYVVNKEPLQIDAFYVNNDPSAQPEWDRCTPDDLYK